MVDSRAGTREKLQDQLENLMVLESKDVLEKGWRNQPDGAPNGQSQTNLSNKTVLDYTPKFKGVFVSPR